MSLNVLERNDLFEFGSFRLDTRARLLLRDGIPVPLPPKAYETLVFLVRNRGRAVTREELSEVVWPDVVVSDGSLTQAVFLLRKALGETEDGPRFVETVPRIGYRFLGDVREGVAHPPLSPSAQAAPAAARSAEPTAAAASGSVDPDGRHSPNSAAPEVAPGPWHGPSHRPPPPGPWHGPPPRPSARRPPIALVLACLAALAALAGILLLRPRAKAPRAVVPATQLLTVKRELPVPPDATSLLGRVEKSFVLAAPGAYYLLPEDGALAATRIPLGEGETLAGLDGESLVLVRGDRVEWRQPIQQKSAGTAQLPSGIPLDAGRWRLSPDGRFLVLRSPRALEVLARHGESFTRAARLERPARDGEVLAIGPRYLGLAPGGGEPIHVISLADGRTVLEAPFAEVRPTALAIDDGSGLVAVAGAFDAIQLFRVGQPDFVKRVPRRGWTHGLAFVPDAPTLLGSGYYGVAALRGSSFVEDSPGIAAEGQVHPAPDGVFVFSSRRQRLTWLDYAGFPPASRVDAKASVFWAVVSDAAGRTVFAGGRDGKLYALELPSQRLTSHVVHTDGIPSLLRADSFVASASDDKTIGVWELPGPRLLRRSTAHRFLVNDLQVAGAAPGGPTLVTSSSDGIVKTWAWPTLEPRETIDLPALTGKTSELHALWAAPDLSRILAGTWDGALLDLARGGKGWTARRIPMRSRAVYRLAGLPALGVVAGIGLYPHEVFVFDLATGTPHAVDAAGLQVFWCVSDPERNELYAVGNGVSRYTFRLEGASETVGGDGASGTAGRRLRYELVTRRQSGLGLMSVTRLPDGTLWTATADGALASFGPAALAGPPSSVGLVELSP